MGVEVGAKKPEQDKDKGAWTCGCRHGQVNKWRLWGNCRSRLLSGSDSTGDSTRLWVCLALSIFLNAPRRQGRNFSHPQLYTIKANRKKKTGS